MVCGKLKVLTIFSCVINKSLAKKKMIERLLVLLVIVVSCHSKFICFREKKVNLIWQ